MLLDTDVLIDVALDREPFSGPASDLLDRLSRGTRSCYVAWHTISNFYYIVAPRMGGVDTRGFILDLIRFAGVPAVGAGSVRYAASLPMSDFEDAMQVAVAQSCGANRIVTRNIRDYRLSPIPAITPESALLELF